MKLFKNKLAVTVIVLSVSFLILIGYSVKREQGSVVENGVGVTLNSFQGIIYKAVSGAKDSLSFITHFSEVKKENEELKKEISEMNSKVSAYDTLEKENKNLRAALDFKEQRSEFNFIGCDIIGKSGNDVLDQFTINRGKNDGIAIGMAVTTQEGLVGQVTAVYANYSIVQSLANENIEVGALVQETRDSGIVKGFKDNNKEFLAKIYYLPRTSNIQKGNVILTGAGTIYPNNIRIGEVIDVQEDSGKVMKVATIKPFVDFNKLEEVLVVVPKNYDGHEVKYDASK
ncbi:MAG: rod shape-determining protein MreC [Bacillota bacterium]|nr:rod shape-determining protein MreC [Bacillota bacterium]